MKKIQSKCPKSALLLVVDPEQVLTPPFSHNKQAKPRKHKIVKKFHSLSNSYHHYNQTAYFSCEAEGSEMTDGVSPTTYHFQGKKSSAYSR